MLSGLWQIPPEMPPRYLLNLAADLPAEAVKMRPWTAQLFAQRTSEKGSVSPRTRCLPPGIPESYTGTAPFKILETPGQVTILYEEANSFRQIFTDGRDLPEDPAPTWMGYSVGAWHGDDFVVESSGFNEPWTVALTAELIPDDELIEYVCLENERDIQHIVP